MRSRVVEVEPERFDGWLERFAANNEGGPQRVSAVERFDHDPVGLVLVRRGGYAVGVAAGGRLATHKVGTRYVQSRTAAGGWSQQRFARRRANQADELVGATADVAARIVL
ncbi:MAG: Vms1/Ankzf1 family peptidyl-tRNA hydrolase, partial [Phycicoccus sp.]